MKRREFIILSSVGAASAGVFSACGHAEEKLIPALIPDDEYIPGIDVWKASTCAMCDAGCGILVRTRDHKANKIEGNPAHPVNRGALCARGQAGLQVLYNPDRIKAPMKRTGERGAGQFAEVSWDEAIKTLADKLREVKAQGKADKVVFATVDHKGVTGLVAEQVFSAYGSKSLVSEQVLRDKWTLLNYQTAYDNPNIPTFDLANAKYLLSFGARFLETWHSPMMYSQAYGEFRRTSGKARGKFVQIEPRMSVTGASADEWLPATMGSEGLVALALAQVIIREKLVKDIPTEELIKQIPTSRGVLQEHSTTAAEALEWLDNLAPEKTAGTTGIPAEKLIRIAREFAAAQPGLAIGGGSEVAGLIESHSPQDRAIGRSQSQFSAIHFLNKLVGNLNKPGGVLLNTTTFDPLQKWRTATPSDWLSMIRVNLGYSSALLLHHTNPAYLWSDFANNMKEFPFIVSFSSFFDESTQYADLILPDHSYLESWDIHPAQSAGTTQSASLSQPVVKAEGNTRQTGDVLMALSQALGQSISINSIEEFVKQAALELSGKNSAPKKAATDESQEEEESEEEETEEAWIALFESGVLKKEAAGQKSTEISTPAKLNSESVLGDMVTVSKDPTESLPLTLLTYKNAHIGYGEQANLPILQELPDAMTSVMWGSWVEINPKKAAELGIADGDLVEVEASGRKVIVPAVLFPAIHPDVIAMPLGQGHEAFGRFAKDKGVNAAWLNPVALVSETADIGVGAKVVKLSSEGKLIRFGTSLPEHIETKR